MPKHQHPSIVDITLRNPRFMQFAPMCAGPLVNFLLFLLNAVFAIAQQSLWPCSMSIYFLVLCFTGSFVAACAIKPERHSARSVLIVCGVAIIALAISITFLKYIIVAESHHDVLHPFVMIGLAAFTFATAAIAIVDATRARNGNDFQQANLRISIASTLGAMMITEMQMLGTFAELTDTFTTVVIEAISGLVVVLLLLLMGVSLILKARRVH